MVCEELSAVERMVTLLDAIEAGRIKPGDVKTISAEMVVLLSDLAATPAGWVADLGRILSPAEAQR